VRLRQRINVLCGGDASLDNEARASTGEDALEREEAALIMP
jgi:hypothetical protein